MLSTSSEANAQPWRQGESGVALKPRCAMALTMILFFASPVWAQQAPSTDECVAHMELAKELLRSEKPSAALLELDLAFAVRQEPRVLYLQGLAQDKLGNAQESVHLFSRFLAAAPGECCADERAYASRRIVKLRRLMELGVVASGPVAPARPIHPVGQVLNDGDKTGLPIHPVGQRGPRQGAGLMIPGGILTGVGAALLIGAAVLATRPVPTCSKYENESGNCIANRNQFQSALLIFFGISGAIPGIIMFGGGAYQYSQSGP